MLVPSVSARGVLVLSALSGEVTQACDAIQYHPYKAWGFWRGCACLLGMSGCAV